MKNMKKNIKKVGDNREIYQKKSDDIILITINAEQL